MTRAEDAVRELVAELERVAGHPPHAAAPVDRSSSFTIGGGRAYFGVSVPDRRRLVREWSRSHRSLPAGDVLSVADRLSRGETYEEVTLGPMLLSARPDARQLVRPAHLDKWTKGLRGWAEVDSVCQSLLPAEQLLADWVAWSNLVKALSRRACISQRRASLVLLTGPVAHSDDHRLSDLALRVIRTTQSERDILITKAVSWLLRSMVKHHQPAVESYLEKNVDQLPAIAVRETRTKLRTGTKSGRT